jgi:hypothetical protein
MAKCPPINVLFTASVSAVVHGGLALIWTPVLSIVMLTMGAPPVQLARLLNQDRGMLLAAIAPVLWALMGFVAGATMAFLYNLSVIDASKDEIALVTLRHPQRAVGQAASLTATTNLLCEQTRDVFSNSGAAAEKLDVSMCRSQERRNHELQ